MRSLDPDIIAQLREDLPPDIFARIVRSFEEDASRLVADLDAACAAGDGAGFRRAAHTLAGAAGTVGALPLEEAARRCMVSVTDAEHPELCARALAEADEAVAALRATLQEAG